MGKKPVKKSSFSCKKDHFVCSVKEVENFLRNLNKASASIKVFKNLR